MVKKLSLIFSLNRIWFYRKFDRTVFFIFDNFTEAETTKRKPNF